MCLHVQKASAVNNIYNANSEEGVWLHPPYRWQVGSIRQWWWFRYQGSEWRITQSAGLAEIEGNRQSHHWFIYESERLVGKWIDGQ